MSTATTVFIWNRRTDYHHAVLAEHVRNSAGLGSTRTSSPTAGSRGSRFQYVDQVVTGQAMNLGVNDVFYVLGAIFFC